MKPAIRLAFVLAAKLAVAATGAAQAQITQSSVGACSPNIANVEGTVQLSFRCDSLIVDRYVYQIDDGKAGILASHYNITINAVRNFLQELTGENTPPYEMPHKLAALVTRIKGLEGRVQSISVTAELESDLAALKDLLNDGRLDAAEKLAERLSDKSNATDSELFKSLADKIKIQLANGELKAARFKYDEAAIYFKKAAAMAPNILALLHAQSRVLLAESLQFGTADRSDARRAIHEAVSATEGLVDEAPVLRFRALTVMIHNLGDLDKIVTVFNTKVKPLLGKSGASFTGYFEYCYSCVAKAYINVQRYHDALSILLEGEALSKKMMLPDPVGLSAIYQNTWLAYALLGRRADAIAALDKSEALLRQVSPDELHPNFIHTLTARSAMADPEESLRLRIRAFEVAATVFPFKHNEYQNALGMVLGQERITSEQVVASVYEIHARNVGRVLGDTQPVAMADAIADFATHLAEGGAFAISLPYFRKAIDIGESKKASSGTIAIAYFLAAQIIDDDAGGSAEEAERYYRKAIVLYEDNFGVMDTRTQDVRKKYLRFYASRKRPAEARRLLDEFKTKVRAGADKQAANRMIAELEKWAK